MGGKLEMEIILKQDIKNLGEKDDIVNVKPGYGRNYLIPTRICYHGYYLCKESIS